MKRKSVVLATSISAALALGFAGGAFATDGYQLDGIGQYAMGMAGAVVAAPDDPLSAALSNPAGMAFLAPQAAFSAEIFNPVRKANFGAGEIGSHSNIYGVPAIGWVAPAFAKNWVFGGGVYGTSGMGVNYLQNMPSSLGYPNGSYSQDFSSVNFMQMSPTVAWKVNHRLAVGATLNIGAEQVSFQEGVSMPGFPTGIPAGYGPQTATAFEGLNLSTPNWSYGVGATLGVLYKVNSMVTLGASYKTPMIFTPVTWQAGTQAIGPGGTQGQYSAHLNYPQQVALGLAIRPIKPWLISVEGQWINWHNTMNTFNIYGPWNGTSQFDLPMHWSNEFVANIGTQYTVNNWLQVRAGYTHGSDPIGNSQIANDLILPAIMTNAITAGATQKIGMGWSLTEAYMHSFAVTDTGQPGTAFLAPGDSAVSPSTTMSENSYGLQIGYKF